ncbi:MafI family immunity protein [Chitinimonas viridis]|uniref:MafI family immunity protein n=1 Tax=Chitinimonas viridis TaxID=664880 RepID=UPI003570A000
MRNSTLDYDSIELDFAHLLTAMQPMLSASECDEVREYVDVGEYGLALRTAVAIYVEESKVATAEVRELISRLAKKMGQDAEVLLKRLG